MTRGGCAQATAISRFTINFGITFFGVARAVAQFGRAYEVVYMWAAANHHVPYVGWREHPVYCAVWLCAIPFWREFHF